MDYIGNKCPVCDNYFHVNDDIVVCPECGTPAHRECYNKNGGCINADKHKDGYDYSSDSQQNVDSQDGGTVCKKCGTHNEEDLFFCKKCGNPLSENIPRQSNNPYTTQTSGAPPFGNIGQNIFVIDPLGGVNPETDFGDGVTAGECAKYVKQSTQYFITVFNSIKKFAKSRFNFCAFFFGGGYLLYRKMYSLGALITAFQAFVIGAGYYFTSTEAYNNFFNAFYIGDLASYTHHFGNLSDLETILLSGYLISTVLVLVIIIVLGICANKMYFKHCKKQVIRIKSKDLISGDKDKELSKKGGVNMPLAMSLLVSYLILSYIPSFFL